jgi:hypothetical protein
MHKVKKINDMEYFMRNSVFLRKLDFGLLMHVEKKSSNTINNIF